MKYASIALTAVVLVILAVAWLGVQSPWTAVIFLFALLLWLALLVGKFRNRHRPGGSEPL